MLSNLDKNRKIALVAAVLLFFVRQSDIDLTDLLSPQKSVQVEEDKIPKPSQANIDKCAELTELFKTNTDLAYDSAYFYMAFADVIIRNPRSFVKENEDFKRYNEIALDFMFENNPAKGKIDGLGEKIDEILKKELGDDPTKAVDNKQLGDLLFAIGWTAYNAI